LTSELERIKILEGKITQVVEYINKLLSENKRLKQQISELKSDKKKFEEQAKQATKLDQHLQKYEEERKVIKDKVETIIDQIDQLGL
jgi:5'-deoxynucleotidase YfbR-like HD superfamily hydrolase